MDVLSRRALTVLLILTCLSCALAQTREYQIKTAFIYNFLKFVEWPATDGPLKIGVLGTDPFDGGLKQLESRDVGGRSLVVGTVKSPEDAKNFQVVFVADPAQSRALIKATSGLPVLTISDAPGFSQAGGGITFVSSKNRIRFQLNATALQSAKLKPSSKLLSLASDLY